MSQLIGALSDVTDQVELNYEKDRLQDLFHALFDQIPAAVYVRDLNDRFIHVNRALEDVVSMKRQSILGRSLDEVFPPAVANEFKSNDRIVINAGRCVIFEEQTTVQGQMRRFDSYKFPLIDQSGNRYAVAGISIDVEDKLRALQELEIERLKVFQSSKLAALGEMAGGIAHEINNPLAIIYALANRLGEMSQQKDVDIDRLRQTAERIESTTMRISRIIAGLRVIARDGSEEQAQPVRLNEILDDVLGLCSEKMKNAGIDFQLLFPDNQIINCKRVQFSQVLLNLITNSYQAVAGLESPWIRVHASCEGGKLAIKVQDSGPGVPQSIRERIFEPFFTTKEIGSGTGLGLSISKTIIESHHGRLILDTQGSCTSFVIEVPNELSALRAA